MNEENEWILFQKLWWAFMVDFTNVPQEELNEIFGEPDEDDIEEITKRNLEEEGPLYSKEDILRNMWSEEE